MVKQRREAEKIIKFLSDCEYRTLDELKEMLNTNSTMSVYRKLKKLNHLSSYSHRGKYYKLYSDSDFDDNGLCFFQSISFSKYGNLMKTAEKFIDSSSAGYNVIELRKILNIEVKEPLLNLFKKKKVHRIKIQGIYVYFSINIKKRKAQQLQRKSRQGVFEISITEDTESFSNKLKAAIIIFYSLLDEKQRRLFSGLESFKLGHGGDRKIARLLDIDTHTVSKGRKEIIGETVLIDPIRNKGGGRKPVEKKLQK